MLMWTKRTLLALALGLATSAWSAYPARPLRIIVNTAAGGYTDAMTRLFAQRMGEYLQQPVIVENRAGGDGLIAIRAAKAAPADGYTLLASSATIVQQMVMRADPGYDVAKDFAGVGALTRAPFLMLEGHSKPDRNLGDFMARARSSPGKLTFASAGVGTGPHFAAAQFLRETGLSLLHVPYKGNGPALPDVTSGRVDMIFSTYDSAGGLANAGQLRVLAVSSTQRHPAFPQVPTFIESGLPQFTYYTWVGLLAPAGTPAEAISRLGDALRYARSVTSLTDHLQRDGNEVMEETGPAFDRFLASELTVARKLMTDLALTPQ